MRWTPNANESSAIAVEVVGVAGALLVKRRREGVEGFEEFVPFVFVFDPGPIVCVVYPAFIPKGPSLSAVDPDLPLTGVVWEDTGLDAPPDAPTIGTGGSNMDSAVGMSLPFDECEDVELPESVPIITGKIDFLTDFVPKLILRRLAGLSV